MVDDVEVAVVVAGAAEVVDDDEVEVVRVEFDLSERFFSNEASHL